MTATHALISVALFAQSATSVHLLVAPSSLDVAFRNYSTTTAAKKTAKPRLTHDIRGLIEG
ncbi:hypothetical protein NEUTE2DRAFT_72479 [Neurospora tetrasperma FGSC 2509]|nr:hypothetical protein NEUTE2DRAFT_72479 [Neurospora tetrasperma FGSC 2509]